MLPKQPIEASQSLPVEYNPIIEPDPEPKLPIVINQPPFTFTPNPPKPKEQE